MRNVNTHRVESSRQSTVTSDQLPATEGAVESIPGNEWQDYPGLGKCAWRFANLCRILLALGRMDLRGSKPCWRQC